MSSIPANIANFVAQEVRIPSRTPLLPVFEAVHNGLDAIVERGTAGTVRVRVERHPGETDGSRGMPFAFTVSDDGIGLTAQNMAAFDETFSDRKRPRGGKGRGRFTYLKVFDDIRFESVFEEDGKRLKRSFRFGLDYKGCPSGGTPTSEPIGTKVVLSAMIEEYAKQVPKDSAILMRDFITQFMPVLLSNTSAAIILNDGTDEDLAKIVRSDLLLANDPDGFTIGERVFDLQHVRLRARRGLRHRLILAAAAREVSGVNLDKHIPTLPPKPLGASEDDEGYVVFGVVQGDYLDEIADPLRLSFRDEGAREQSLGSDEDAPAHDLLGDPLSSAQIAQIAIERVRKRLAPELEQAVKERSDAIANYIQRDGMGYHFLRPTIPAIAEKLGATDDRAIENALHSAAYQERRARSQQVDALLKATPKEKADKTYFERWHATVSKLSAEAKSDLADYVAHRRAILDLVEDLLRSTPEGTYRREEVIHSIIFPKGKQTGQVGFEQQNLWLIDERLTFHEHLFSDISVKTITGGEVDSGLRPDMAIFTDGFATFHDGDIPVSQLVLVELKQPGREDISKDDPIKKTLAYLAKLKKGKARTEGRAVIDIDEDALTTVYLLSDWTADFKGLLRLYNFNPLPGDVAEYSYRDRDRVMMIAISFKRLLENARRRNRIFFRKLGIEQ
jgi:hypothetical protein